MLRQILYIVAGVCLFAVSSSLSYPPQGPMAEGVEAWVQGDVELAQKYFALATSDEASQVNAWYNLGYLALWEDRIDSAVTLFRRALKYNPDFAPAHLELGRLALAGGNTTVAHRHFEKAVYIPYGTFRAWHLLGETRLALGDTVGAQDAYSKALDNHPGYNKSLIALAELALVSSDTIAAISSFEDAILLSPAPGAFETFIRILDSLGFHERADSVRQDYHELFPEEPLTAVEMSAEDMPSFPIGEYLKYSFRWEFVKLGTAEMTVVGRDTLDNCALLRVHVSMKSAPLIVFINVEDEYDVWINPVTGICHRFYFRMNSYGVDLIGQWEYQYREGNYISRTAVDDGYIFGIRQKVLHELVDGASLMYHLRFRTQQDISSPFYFVMDDEYKTGELVRIGETKLFRVGDREIIGTQYQGILHCRGIVGLSGGFYSWFSKDPMSLLLRAKARIAIGSLSITLMEYSP